MFKKTKTRSFILFGVIAGFLFASWAFQIQHRISLLRSPLVWPLKILFSHGNARPGSISGFVIFISTWFVYWACIGALTAFLLRLLFQFLKKRKDKSEAMAEDSDIQSQENKQWSGMQLFYLLGFMALAIFFTLVQQKLHGWKPIGFILLWLSILATISFPTLKIAWRFPPSKPYSAWCFIHAGLRTLPAALLFSPTFVNFYMFGFPAPATLTVLGSLFADRKQIQGLLWGNLVVAIACFLGFWLIISTICFIWQSEKLSKSKLVIRGFRYLGFIAGAFALIALVAHWIYHAPLLQSETSTFSMAQAKEENRYIEWCQEFPNYIIPRMCDYYKLHPECFKPTGNGEEIEIDGFGAFIKSDDYFKNHLASVRWGKIRDPWGEPLGFVQDLNMDGYIDVASEHRLVMKLGPRDKPEGLNGEHHFGIYKQSPFKGPFGQPWERIFVETY